MSFVVIRIFMKISNKRLTNKLMKYQISEYQIYYK